MLGRTCDAEPILEDWRQASLGAAVSRDVISLEPTAPRIAAIRSARRCAAVFGCNLTARYLLVFDRSFSQLMRSWALLNTLEFGEL